MYIHLWAGSTSKQKDRGNPIIQLHAQRLKLKWTKLVTCVWAANLEKNFNDTMRTDILATEFCATSIS